MADNNEESIRRETEAREAATKSTVNTTKQLADAFEDLIDRNKSAKDKLDKLNKELDTGKKRLVDIGPALEDLQESIEKTVDAGERAQLQDQLERKQQAASREQYRRMVVDSGAAILAAAGNFGVNLTKSVLTSYQSNASAFQTAGDLVNVGIDSASQGFKGIANAASVAGGGLMFLGPKGVAAGLALQGLAVGINFLTDKFSDLAKFGINVAVKELETQTKAFAAASAAGALFSQGMGEMRRSATVAGLTQEQFAKVTSENAATFAMFGGTVGAGAQRFAQINKQMGVYQTGLVKLGYSIEEIADGTAQYMALQAASGRGQRTDYANLAKETDAYLTNLRVITAFTGEDAKKAQARARDASTQLAVDQKIREMELSGDKDARQRFENTIMSLPESLKKPFQQYFLTNGAAITDPAAATAIYNNREALELFRRSLLNANDSTLSGAEITKRFQTNQIELGKTAFESNKDFNKALGISTALIGKNAEETAVLTAFNELFKKTQIDGTKSATETANDQKKNTDTLSVATADAVKSMQDLRIQIQDKLTGAITNFATFIPSIIKGIDDALEKFLKKYDSGDKGTGTPGTNIEFGGGGGGGPGVAVAPGTNTEIMAARRSVAKQQAADSGTAKLNLKSDEAVAGGPVTTPLMELAYLIQNSLGSNLKYFSGLNDTGRDANSKHKSGTALDVVLNDPLKYESTLAMIKGLPEVSFAQYEKKGQKNANGSVASGDHIHAEVKAAQGAVVPATTGGTNVTVGEGGASEVIAPLKNGRLPGMDEMIDRLDQMISVLKDHRDTSEKIFQATA